MVKQVLLSNMRAHVQRGSTTWGWEWGWEKIVSKRVRVRIYYPMCAQMYKADRRPGGGNGGRREEGKGW